MWAPWTLLSGIWTGYQQRIWWQSSICVRASTNTVNQVSTPYIRRIEYWSVNVTQNTVNMNGKLRATKRESNVQTPLSWTGHNIIDPKMQAYIPKTVSCTTGNKKNLWVYEISWDLSLRCVREVDSISQQRYKRYSILFLETVQCLFNKLVRALKWCHLHDATLINTLTPKTKSPPC